MSDELKAIHNVIGDFYFNEPDFDEFDVVISYRRVRVPKDVVRKISDAAIAVHCERTRPEPADDEGLVDLREEVQEAINDCRDADNREMEELLHRVSAALTRPTGEYERGLEEAAKVAGEIVYKPNPRLGKAIAGRIAKRIRNLKGQP